MAAYDSAVRDIWDELDPAAEPKAVWLRTPAGAKTTILLGAFDPPTLAHLALARRGAAGAFGMTKVLLDRTQAPLLDVPTRLYLLDELASEYGLGLLVRNRGTYLDVAQAVRMTGYDPAFVIGADKLRQLRDPAHYPDGVDGVARTFTQVSFVVVPRPGADVDVGGDVLVAEPLPADLRDISATRVREKVADGEPLDGWVPAGVELALRGYTDRIDER
jgi:nicotinic acid mononucleotide adenylyltransferase